MRNKSRSRSSAILGFILVLSVLVNKCCTAESSHSFAVCHTLSLALPSQVSYAGNATYTASLQSYFSDQEADLSPACIVTPKTSQDVATLIKILASLNLAANNVYQFAIRSGGHTPWAGSANINSGVTVDLSSINEVVVNLDRTITSIGPGARWEKVYLQLDTMNLTVAGGRAAQVGVGGYLVGGGISYFAPRLGFGCDNVINFEVVLASGQLIQVNQTSNPDLWIALKGGSNNFGIVTRYDMRTISQGKMWGGQVIYPSSTASQQLAALFSFNVADGYDEYASVIASFGFAAGVGVVAVNSLEYTSPVVNPPTLQPFTAIQPQLENTMRITNLTDITIEQNEDDLARFRYLTITTTFQNDLSMLNATYKMWYATVAQITAVANITYALVFEPIPPAITSKSAPLGGDSLGLNPSTGPLVLIELSISWGLASDDDLIIGIAEKLIADVDRVSKEKGLFNRWKYLNYAWKNQNPIAGYGPQNKASLQAASRKYDPHGLFQQAVPGGFKLFNSDDY